jgi:hypothetical protein
MAGPSKEDRPLQDKEKHGLQLPKTKKNAANKTVITPIIRHAPLSFTNREVSYFWNFCRQLASFSAAIR